MIPKMPRPDIDLAPRNTTVIGYPTAKNISVVTGVTTRLPFDGGLYNCLQSVSSQVCPGHGLVLLIDGTSSSTCAANVQLPLQLLDRTWIVSANCGSPARARNALLDFVDASLPDVQWIMRLDSDDSFASDNAVFAAIELGNRREVTAVLGGNNVLSRDGHLLNVNPATQELYCQDYILNQIGAMADGTVENELPSCNLLIKARSGHRYPDMASAEDHWLVAGLFFHHAENIAVLEAPILVNYRLYGEATVSAENHPDRILVKICTWQQMSGRKSTSFLDRYSDTGKKVLSGFSTIRCTNIFIRRF